MCVVSMVYDYYRPRIEPYYPWYPGSSPTIYPQVDEFQKLIEEFKEAIKAARRVDDLTGQPDCSDPEKAKLEERVAELERQLRAKKRKAKRASAP
jgi:hypothetical protein